VSPSPSPLPPHPSAKPLAAGDVVFAYARAGRIRPWLESLHPRQRSVIESPTKFKAAVCGRRAGKSDLEAKWLIDGCVTKPGSLNAFIGVNSRSAKRTVWAVIARVVRENNLRAQPNETELTWRFANGSVLWIAGCADESETEKFRGPTPSYYRVAIDEAASFRGYLHRLVEDVLSPALMDFDGELLLAGTPGAACAGWFHDLTTGANPEIASWETHRWTALDNPHVKAREMFAAALARNGWTEDHPTFRREYLGEWIRDVDALVYPYRPEVNDIDALPAGHRWRTVLAIDCGFVDSMAYALVCYAETCPFAVITKTWKVAGQTPSQSADEVQRLRESMPITKIVYDTGGLGKAYAEEARQRHGIPAFAADKTDKAAHVKYMAADIRTGRVRVIPAANHALTEEWKYLQWNEDHTSIDDRYEDHAADAGLYGWRDCRHYLAVEPAAAAPREGESGFSEARADEILAHIIKRQQDAGKNWFRSGVRR